jgi:integrase/recombinase XerD
MSTDAAKQLQALSEDISAFHHYLQSERGLARNTLLAYGHDLERFATWVAAAGLGSYLRPSVRELGHFLEFLRDEKLAPPSVARHLVSLKMFYRFLRLEERVASSAVELLSSPSLWDRIPQVLSPESIEKLLAAPQPQERFYLRDKAILETMYATGSRASEVIGLKVQDLFLDARFCKCFGKGGKQRVVPLGRLAVNALDAYMAQQRPRLVRTAP